MSTKQIFILAIIILVVILAITGVVLKLFVFNGEDEEVEKEVFNYSHEQQLRYNLKETSRVAVLKVVIGTTDEELLSQFEEKSYLINDTVNGIVRDKTYKELEGSEGVRSLKKEILAGLNKAYESEEIVKIHFDEFIIQ